MRRNTIIITILVVGTAVVSIILGCLIYCKHALVGFGVHSSIGMVVECTQSWRSERWKMWALSTTILYTYGLVAGVPLRTFFVFNAIIFMLEIMSLGLAFPIVLIRALWQDIPEEEELTSPLEEVEEVELISPIENYPEEVKIIKAERVETKKRKNKRKYHP